MTHVSRESRYPLSFLVLQKVTSPLPNNVNCTTRSHRIALNSVADRAQSDLQTWWGIVMTLRTVWLLGWRHHQWQHHRYLLLHVRQLQENFQRMQETYHQNLHLPQLHLLHSSNRPAHACFHSSTSKGLQECGLETAVLGLCQFQLLQLELRWD